MNDNRFWFKSLVAFVLTGCASGVCFQTFVTDIQSILPDSALCSIVLFPICAILALLIATRLAREVRRKRLTASQIQLGAKNGRC
jgi:ABC-type cobalamin transport system permease subunit